MRVLTVPIMEGIDGEEEDRMSATTDSLNTSNDNDDKNSNSNLNTSFNEKLNDVNDFNYTENNVSLLKNKDSINDSINNIDKSSDSIHGNAGNNNNENDMKNEKLMTKVKQKTFPSNTTHSASSDITDNTVHESEKFSIILDAGSESFKIKNNGVLDSTKMSLIDDKIDDVFIENSDMIKVEKMKDDKSTITTTNTENKNENSHNNNNYNNDNDERIQRTESNPRDELIMTFASAILKSGTRSIDSQNDIRSNYDLNLNLNLNLSSSSDSSRRNSQVHSASGLLFVICYVSFVTFYLLCVICI